MGYPPWLGGLIVSAFFIGIPAIAASTMAIGVARYFELSDWMYLAIYWGLCALLVPLWFVAVVLWARAKARTSSDDGP